MTVPDRYRTRGQYFHHTISAEQPGLPASSVDSYLTPSTRLQNRVASKAYERLVDKLRDGNSASLGASIAEGRSAFEMIATRAIMLRKAYVAVRRGHIQKAARLLGIPPDTKYIPKQARSRRTPGKVSKKHYASAHWLELHFGWTPLLGDISDAVDVLTSPNFGSRKIVASASSVFTKNHSEGAWGANSKSSGRFGVRFEGDVRISNPNAFLASQLGLVNPAAIAWELVPFSFVVDWFSNVGQILDSYSDFVGVTWEGGSQSTRISSEGTYTHMGVGATSPKRITLKSQRRGVLWSPPRPQFTVSSPFGGPKRAATQIALLVQLFLKP